MSILTLQDAGLIAVEPLFRGLDLSLDARDRIGLVAGNGSGKTSLMHCMLGEMELSEGNLTRSRGLKIAVVPQDVADDLSGLTLHEAVLTALPEVEHDYESWRVDVVLDEFGAPEEMRGRPLEQLSGGWQRVAQIARAWVTEPDLLVLDEPTNHLDLEKRLLLERWLLDKSRDAAMVIASHDRAFLDATTNRTLFLRPSGSRVFPLPYSKARAALDESDEAAKREQETQLKEAARLRRNAAKLKNIGVNSGSDLLTTKAKQLKARAADIEEAQKELHKDRTAAIQLSNSGTHAKVLLALEDVDVSTPEGALLFRTGKQHIFQGDRIVLLGPNGTGKSVFVRMLRDVIAGRREVPGTRATPSIELGYADQSLDHIPDDQTPLAYITRNFDVGDARGRALLAGAGFAHEFQTRPIKVMSWGQKSRLGLLGLRLAEPNFYLLDEPTNHIDIPGQDDLAAEIKDRGATCFLVSHDRQFVRDVGTRFWVVEKARITEADDPEAFFASQGEGAS